MPIQSIPASQLPKIIEDGHALIDVRSPAEFRGVHVEQASLHPLPELDGELFCQRYDPAQPVYLLCQSGKRAHLAAKRLEAAGHTQIFVVEGGTDAAIKAGVCVIRGAAAISIERQVRIAAGLLVVLGCLLSLFAHPGFLGLPIFVGAGLAFAGITDSCGMGAILARMPWNR